MDDDAVLIELDPRRRTTIRVGRHDRYLAREEFDGTVILTPAVVISEAELELRSHPELLAEMERTMADPSTWVRRGRPVRKPE